MCQEIGKEKELCGTSPDDPVLKNQPSNAGYLDLIPGHGTKIPHTVGQLSQHAVIQTQHIQNLKKIFSKMNFMLQDIGKFKDVDLASGMTESGLSY